jgi:hypothetical protein
MGKYEPHSGVGCSSDCTSAEEPCNHGGCSYCELWKQQRSLDSARSRNATRNQEAKARAKANIAAVGYKSNIVPMTAGPGTSPSYGPITSPYAMAEMNEKTTITRKALEAFAEAAGIKMEWNDGDPIFHGPPGFPVSATPKPPAPIAIPEDLSEADRAAAEEVLGRPLEAVVNPADDMIHETKNMVASLKKTIAELEAAGAKPGHIILHPDQAKAVADLYGQEAVLTSSDALGSLLGMPAKKWWKGATDGLFIDYEKSTVTFYGEDVIETARKELNG